MADDDIVLKISSPIHGERAWRKVRTHKYATRDGRLVDIVHWQSSCVICGGPFEVTTTAGVSSSDGSHSFELTTCPTHRMTPAEVSKLRRAKKDTRRTVFESIRRRKLADG